MGVNLKDLVTHETLEFQELHGKIIAVDALNTLYQFLSIIRQPDGTPLMDSKGRVTSHLSGLIYRTTRLIEYGIKPVYVFDGKPPLLKKRTIEARAQVKSQAAENWHRAVEEGRLEDAKKHASRTSRFSADMLADSKRLLEQMGVPFVQAPSEGEAQCSFMCQRGDAWAVGSQDYDCLLFGAPRLVKGLTLSGKSDLSMIRLDRVLEETGLTRERLIDLAILVGTDFNSGIKGIGPKKALKIVLSGELPEVDFDLDEVRRLFLQPDVTEDYRLEWRGPDRDGLLEFLCEDHEFSRERIEKAAGNLEKAMLEFSQKSLDAWF